MPKILNHIWASVSSSDDALLGTIYDIVSADVSKMIDGIGTFSLELSANNTDTFALLSNGKRIRIYLDTTTSYRYIGGGIIHAVKISEGSGSAKLVVNGPDFLDDLARKSVLLNRQYDGETVVAIAADLISLAPGWTSSVEDSLGLQTSRFDGTSVFKSTLRLAQEIGCHIREGSNPKTLELGRFGTNRGVQLMNVISGVADEAYSNPNIAFITNISEDVVSDDVVDWVIPIGSGAGSTALTLAKSTRTSPLPIQTMTGPDGTTLYYLSTAISEAASTQRVITFKEIGPIANTEASKVAAANALYDAAVAWLTRNDNELTTYNVTCNSLPSNVIPGDKIRLTYRGRIRDAKGKFLKRIDVDDYFWVMTVKEKISSGGSSVTLTINSIDRQNLDTDRIIVGMLESIFTQKVSIQTFPFYFENTYTDMISDSDGKTANFQITFNNYITDLIRCGLRIRTFPLSNSTNPVFGGSPYVTWQVKYGYNYPYNMSISIDGIDRTSTLGGPWGPTNAAIDVELDITQYLINAAGGLYQNHTIIFTAANRYGEIGVLPFSGHSDFWASSGVVEASFKVMGTARAVVPAP